MRQFYTIYEQLCTEIKACQKINKRSILKVNAQTKQHNYQTKTMLSPQSPQRSRNSVTHVRRRDHRPPLSGKNGKVYLANMERQGILVSY